MPRGGARPGSGRKQGSANIRTRQIADKAVADGMTPLEVMLDSMRFFYEEAVKLKNGLESDSTAIGAAFVSASAMAKDAAPYIHPRLNSVELGGRDGEPLSIGFTIVIGDAKDRSQP